MKISDLFGKGKNASKQALEKFKVPKIYGEFGKIASKWSLKNETHYEIKKYLKKTNNELAKIFQNMPTKELMGLIIKRYSNPFEDEKVNFNDIKPLYIKIASVVDTGVKYELDNNELNYLVNWFKNIEK